MQKNWIKILTTEFYSEIKLNKIQMKHGKRVFIENLQEDGGWHYDLIRYPKHVLELELKIKFKQFETNYSDFHIILEEKM